MLCDECLKEMNAYGICKGCFIKEQREGDKLAIRLARANEKIYKLQEQLKKKGVKNG